MATLNDLKQYIGNRRLVAVFETGVGENRRFLEARVTKRGDLFLVQDFGENGVEVYVPTPNNVDETLRILEADQVEMYPEPVVKTGGAQ